MSISSGNAICLALCITKNTFGYFVSRFLEPRTLYFFPPFNKYTRTSNIQNKRTYDHKENPTSPHLSKMKEKLVLPQIAWQFMLLFIKFMPFSLQWACYFFSKGGISITIVTYLSSQNLKYQYKIPGTAVPFLLTFLLSFLPQPS